ncbi:PLP-dependent aminotransferase family protein [Nevskia sp.]|uniref:aminotransferase-like domain-containing protein n=1 Tax=Nevskia sp. TaxID=1929292 RepID=UPI0025E4D26D|nr:PLP-dependent aminotransferase family protein [Nevskia sp.]
MTLYKRYADELATLIASGALQPDERLPSVREASRKRALSEMTVLRAYHRLEASGLIVAKPRSGYYVCAQRAKPPKPALSKPLARSTTIDKSELIYELLAAIRRPSVVPLGSAFPSPKLLPLKALHASLNRSVRGLDPWRTVVDLSPGNPELRRLIALRYRGDGIAIEPEGLVITDGAMEALSLCLQTVTSPGDAVIIESPTFYASLQALERLRLRAVEVPTDPETGVDLDALATALKRHKPAACWLMTSFQNPLGASMPDARKQALVALLAQHGVPLIEDDVYGELHYGESRFKPAKAWDEEGLVLHCSSFSKCLAPGYRIGWAAPGRYTAKVERLKLGSSLSAAVPSQLALADYLATGSYERHLRKLREQLIAGRDSMLAAIQQHFPDGTRVTRPDGGYFLWVELPKGVDTRVLQQAALAQDISLAPGALFSARDDFGHCLRLNYGHPDDGRVDAALATLGRLARA